MSTTSAIVYYSLIDAENENVPIDSLPCNHNLVAKGFLARNLTHGKAIHRVLLSNLVPDRRYCYEISSGRASSHLYSFRTAANKTDHSANFIINGHNFEPKTQQIDQNDLLNIFEQNSKKENQYTNVLESFRRQISVEKMNAFINLPSIGLSEFNRSHSSQEVDFLDHYAEVLSNVQLLPTIGNSGKRFCELLIFRSTQHHQTFDNYTISFIHFLERSYNVV